MHRITSLLAIAVLVMAGDPTPAPQPQTAMPSALGAAPPVIMTYPEYLATLRSDAPSPMAIMYCGSRANRMMRFLASGQVKTSPIPVIPVAADDQISSPVSGRMVRGKDLWNLYAGAPGSLVILDGHGHPIPMAVIPQVIHGDDPAIIHAHLGYLAGPDRAKMSFGEYLRATGMEERVNQAAARFKHGFFGVYMDPTRRVLQGIAPDGGTYDPWSNPGAVTVISEDPLGRATAALVANLAANKSTIGVFIALVVPAGTDTKPILAAYPGIFLVQADLSDIRAGGVSPRTVITTGLPPKGTGRGCEIWGWFPFEALAARLGYKGVTSVPNLDDIPIGETDAGVMPLVDSRLDDARNLFFGPAAGGR